MVSSTIEKQLLPISLFDFFGRISIETDLYRDLIWWLDPLHYVLIVQINWLRSRNGLGTQFSFMTCEPIASGNNGQPSQSTQLKGLRLLKFNRSNSYFQNSSKTTNCLDRPILQFYRWKFCIRKNMSQQQKWPNIANLRHLKSPGIRSHFSSCWIFLPINGPNSSEILSRVKFPNPGQGR